MESRNIIAKKKKSASFFLGRTRMMPSQPVATTQFSFWCLTSNLTLERLDVAICRQTTTGTGQDVQLCRSFGRSKHGQFCLLSWVVFNFDFPALELKETNAAQILKLEPSCDAHFVRKTRLELFGDDLENKPRSRWL